MNCVDLNGLNPIYSTKGDLLGTDDNGLQGEAIIMDSKSFTQGMSLEDALSYNLGKDGLDGQAALSRFNDSFNNLCNRPDWDGNLTLKRYSNHSVRAFSDIYDFDMHSWWNPFNWARDVETLIGRTVAGQGTKYEINIYGSKQLRPFLPWIK